MMDKWKNTPMTEESVKKELFVNILHGQSNLIFTFKGHNEKC
jgi:hypothetical protein